MPGMTDGELMDRVAQVAYDALDDATGVDGAISSAIARGVVAGLKAAGVLDSRPSDSAELETLRELKRRVDGVLSWLKSRPMVRCRCDTCNAWRASVERLQAALDGTPPE
jgi:hypothetical protein